MTVHRPLHSFAAVSTILLVAATAPAPGQEAPPKAWILSNEEGLAGEEIVEDARENQEHTLGFTTEFVTEKSRGAFLLGQINDPPALVLLDPILGLIEVPWPREAPPATQPLSVAHASSRFLVDGLGHRSPFIGDRCQALLVQQGAQAGPSLLAALRSDNSQVLRRTLDVLAQCPLEKARVSIRRCLRHQDEIVRWNALQAYQASGALDFVDQCRRRLWNDSSPFVQVLAASLLSHAGDLETVDVILDELPDAEERGVRLAFFDALRRLTGQRFGSNEEHWRSWWTNHREEFLAEAEEQS